MQRCSLSLPPSLPLPLSLCLSVCLSLSLSLPLSIFYLSHWPAVFVSVSPPWPEAGAFLLSCNGFLGLSVSAHAHAKKKYVHLQYASTLSRPLPRLPMHLPQGIVLAGENEQMRART